MNVKDARKEISLKNQVREAVGKVAKTDEFKGYVTECLEEVFSHVEPQLHRELSKRFAFTDEEHDQAAEGIANCVRDLIKKEIAKQIELY